MGEGRRVVVDAELRAAVRALRATPGSGAALRAVDARLRGPLLRYFLEPPFTREDAEDLVQKTMLLVFRNASELREEERFVGWVYAIARNVKITERSRARAEMRLVVHGVPEPADPSAPGEDAPDGDARAAAVRTAIEALPSRQRQCLLLRVRDELPYEEIAELLGLSVLTVRNHIAEGKKSLRRSLGDDAERGGR